MRIYSMTATFGKLEQQTLTLKPGLNVIYAPNEWGKSTWCSFLIAMLYGLDTRAKSTRSILADKDRFVPWSGSPMSGRMELEWNGRNITIERSTKGRVPMGEFRAYETESGLNVPELNAANCGTMLLGVEQSVFRRAGFIRLADLPVTQDETLRKRLNALVTTGDDSGDDIRLEQSLRELKNRCRYNQTGLLPQAESQKQALEQKLNDFQTLLAQKNAVDTRLKEAEKRQEQLENHIAAALYNKAQEDARKVSDAQTSWYQAGDKLAALETECAELPEAEDARQQIQLLNELREKITVLETEGRTIPVPPKQTESNPLFRGMEPEDAISMVDADSKVFWAASKHGWLIPFLLGLLVLGCSAAFFWYTQNTFALPAACVGAFGLLVGLLMKTIRSHRIRKLRKKYGLKKPEQWKQMVWQYVKSAGIQREEDRTYRKRIEEVGQKLDDAHKQLIELCGEKAPEEQIQYLEHAIAAREEMERVRKAVDQAEMNYHTLRSMAKQADPPKAEDTLTLTAEETQRSLVAAKREQQELLSRQAKLTGSMAALGDAAELGEQLKKVQERIRQLEQTYAALTVAQQTLAKASAHLQRRFAPKISSRAQELLSAMTEGRYARLTLGEDFTLRTAAQDENTLHELLWHSDGTIDQLYLALRLSVAESITPDAPLILDDALVRFDERRLKAAMKLLHTLSEHKQVIVFTCQERETKYA